MTGKYFSLRLCLAALLAGGCANQTAHIPAVDRFEPQRYAGTWYEVARLPNRFERGLRDITAEYRLIGQSAVEVVNSGIDEQSGERRSAHGRAAFTGAADVAELKVTFFWPFSGLYKVIELDREGYSYAMVISKGYDYLWILARTPKLPEQKFNELVAKAAALGFDTGKLIVVPFSGGD